MAVANALTAAWNGRVIAVVAVMSAVIGSGLAAQRAPTRVEWRADLIAGGQTSVHVGAGIHVPAGIYARIGVLGATGATWRAGVARSSTRAELMIRGLFDPLRETPRGGSIGGGVGLSNSRDGTWRPYVLLLVDVEGRLRGRFVPAVQVGLGEGVRIGVAIRSAGRGWR